MNDKNRKAMFALDKAQRVRNTKPKCQLCGHTALNGKLCKRCSDGKKQYDHIITHGTKAQKEKLGVYH